MFALHSRHMIFLHLQRGSVFCLRGDAERLRHLLISLNLSDHPKSGLGWRTGGITMSSNYLPAIRPDRPAWNKGRIIGQKRPLLPKQVWSIRVRLEMADSQRDLTLFNMSVDSKLRGCDLICLKVRDVFVAGRVREGASVTQSKTGTIPSARCWRHMSGRPFALRDRRRCSVSARAGSSSRPCVRSATVTGSGKGSRILIAARALGGGLCRDRQKRGLSEVTVSHSHTAALVEQAKADVGSCSSGRSSTRRPVCR